MATSISPQPENAGPQDRYTHGYGGVTDIFAARTASVQAAFFLPHIRSGMRLLDCGCGPGSITVGLGEVVAPGEVVGIDIAENQIERARVLAEKSGIPNVKFQVASVYELPFPGDSFDAVYANALLEHIGDPLKALSEMRRVLKPGGIIGVRDINSSSDVQIEDEVIQRFQAALHQIWIQNGGDPFIGRRLMSLLLKAGFVNVQGTASFDCFGTPEQAQLYASTRQDLIRDIYGPRMVEMGLVEQSDLAAFDTAFARWAAQPDAFVAVCFCEAVGWKD